MGSFARTEYERVYKAIRLMAPEKWNIVLRCKRNDSEVILSARDVAIMTEALQKAQEVPHA